MSRLLVISIACAVLYSSCARPTVTDIDGNTYHTVEIGNQVWTVENLRTTKLNDGTPIPHVPAGDAWHSLSSPGYCHYGNTTDGDSTRELGALYNWYCVGSGSLAPEGWHVATNDEWDALREHLISRGHNWDRSKSGNRIAKSLAARKGWREFAIEGMPGNSPKHNNGSGFAGLGAGSRFDTRDPIPGMPSGGSRFTSIGQKGMWWSATQVNESVAFVYGLSFCVDGLLQYQSLNKACGHSVRLVKDRE